MDTMTGYTNGIKRIKPSQCCHAYISYHSTDKNIESTLQKCLSQKFSIKASDCAGVKGRSNFQENLNTSDAWIEVLSADYEACEYCKSLYCKFTEIREKRETCKVLQKMIYLPADVTGHQGIKLRVHSRYSAHLDDFAGTESAWENDLELSIITRYHAFVFFSDADKPAAEKVMARLKLDGYIVAHKGSFLCIEDVKREALNKKMSDKIVVFFSKTYMDGHADDRRLTSVVVLDRGQQVCMPIVLELEESVINLLEYFPRMEWLSNNTSSEHWEKNLKTLEDFIDDPDGYIEDKTVRGRNGPPDTLPCKSIIAMMQSVGKILLWGSSTGTGFCVGKPKSSKGSLPACFVVTAYHVLAETIDNLLNRFKTCCADTCSNLGFVAEPYEQFGGHVMDFTQTDQGEIKFGDCDDPQDFLKTVWDIGVIEFMDQKKFFFERNIPFASQKHDVIILKLKQSCSPAVSFPEPLPIGYCGVSRFWHVAGCRGRDEIGRLALATWCPVLLEDDGSPDTSVDLSKIWWYRRASDDKQDTLKKIHTEFELVDGLSLVPFKCTSSFEDGASGSPCMHVEPHPRSGEDDVVLVQGVYLGALPHLYFVKEKEKSEVELAFSHRPEKAISMEFIEKILRQKQMHELIQQLGLAIYTLK